MHTVQTHSGTDAAAVEPFVDEGNAFTAMAALAGEGKNVLDVGCSSAYFAKMLARRGCVITDAPIAEIDRIGLRTLLGSAPRFEVIVCGEALSRLRDPLAMLEEARGFLAEGGYLVASIPNVAHGAVRLSLLAGSFDSQERGASEATPLHFFTKRSIEDLFLSAGFHIGHIERVRQPVFEESEALPRVQAADFNDVLVAEMLAEPDIDTRQFVVQAFALTDEERLRALSKSLIAAGAELAAAQRRARMRERELEETRGHLSRADTEMRRAQESHADIERELRQFAVEAFAFTEDERLRALSKSLISAGAELTAAQRRTLVRERELEEARGHLSRMGMELRLAQESRADIERRLREAVNAERSAHAAELERERLAERAERFALENERLRPFIERAQKAEVTAARLEGREALLERRLAETSENAERERFARENAEQLVEAERRALAALAEERDALAGKYGELVSKCEDLTAERDALESSLAADRERLQSLEYAVADHFASVLAEAQAESAELAASIDDAQRSLFWKGSIWIPRRSPEASFCV